MLKRNKKKKVFFYIFVTPVYVVSFLLTAELTEKRNCINCIEILRYLLDGITLAGTEHL